MPLVVFLVLGTLQLFMMLQARIMAQYAVYKAVRSGSLMHGDCEAMTHTALVALMPTITRVDSPTSLAEAFGNRRTNRYNPNKDFGYGTQIIEIYRESPLLASIQPPILEDNQFDQPATPNASNPLKRLEVRMIYWYRLKIPFADWVMSRMFLAHYDLQAYNNANPLAPVQGKAGWPDGPTATFANEIWPGGPLGPNMRTWSAAGFYLFPLRVTASMKMMVPARRSNFKKPECPL